MTIETKPVNVLIVDDEKRACTNLKNILIEYVYNRVNIAGIANSTAEAEEQISALRPDAIFLDINMPDENAFQFLQRMKPFTFEVVFVTAYDQHAVKAFRLNAIDYILKPIDIDEIKGAVEKLGQRVNLKRMISEDNISYSDLLNHITNKAKNHKITLKSINHSEVIDFDDIFFIEAQSSYSRVIFLKNGVVKEMVVSNPLSDYEELLPASLYYRIHRSYLVNCAHVTNLVNDEACNVVLKSEFTLPVSRRRILALRKFLRYNGHYYE